MRYITYNKAISVNGHTWHIYNDKSGQISHAIKAMISQVDSMFSHHSKLFITRFDIRLYENTPNNKIITDFNRRFHKWLKRKYKIKRIGFIWCREIEMAESQHYHYVLILDGHKVQKSHNINKKIQDLWQQMNGSIYFPKNCFYNINRFGHDATQKAIYRISYLAKAKGKGNRPRQTKDYSASRIKPKVNQ